MKKALALLLVVLMSALCACTPTTSTNVTPTPSGDEPTTGEPSHAVYQYGETEAFSHSEDHASVTIYFPVGELKQADETIKDWANKTLEDAV